MSSCITQSEGGKRGLELIFKKGMGRAGRRETNDVSVKVSPVPNLILKTKYHIWLPGHSNSIIVMYGYLSSTGT